MEAVKTGVFMFQFDEDEPQAIEDVFNREPVTLMLKQVSPTVGYKHEIDDGPAIVFRSKNGKELKLFIKSCE